MTLRIISILRDGCRLYGALLYWNLRKSIYVVLGRKGRAPCQSDSDDEVVGCIGCDAVLHWDKPERFRRLCPLLVKKEEGWRCSVLSKQVRPYWMAALKWYGAVLLALYLFGGMLLWGLMNAVGDARVTLGSILWPGAWSRVGEVQSMALYRQSRIDFALGDLRKAHQALESARKRDPNNYSAALLMAQIHMFQGSYLYADDQYELLLNSHPEKLELTAVNYHDALLSLNRMNRLAEHSLAMVNRDPDRTALWVKSLLLGLSVPEVAETIQSERGDALELLPEFARLLIRAQILQTQGKEKAARRSLREPFRGPWNLQYIQEQIALLLRLGAPGEASNLLGYYGPGLRIAESMAQQYLINLASNDEWGAQSVFRGLLRKDLSAQRILRLQLLLIRAPNRECFLQLHRMLQADAQLAEQVNGAVMWATGLVCNAPVEAKTWQRDEHLIYGDGYPAIDQLDFMTARMDLKNSVIHIINRVDLPRGVIWELLARMNQQRQLELPGG